MNYLNAKDVLSEEFLKEIQKYADGTLLYVPKIEGKEKSWGELSGQKLYYRKRNRMIMNKFRYGISINQLAQEYHLSIETPNAPASVNTAMMTDEEIHAKLQKGYEDAEEGNVASAKEVFVKFRENYWYGEYLGNIHRLMVLFDTKKLLLIFDYNLHIIKVSNKVARLKSVATLSANL